MNIAIIGINGLVGKKILDLLSFPINSLIPVGSKIGNMTYKGKECDILTIPILLTLDLHIHIIFMASTNSVSKKWIPIIRREFPNSWIIDNSSYFRLNPNYNIIIPEINSNLIHKNSPTLICNPNCSTAQLVMVLYPLHLEYDIKRIVISTYQSVSGSGAKGIEQLLSEEEGNKKINSPYIHNIHNNCIPICDEYDSNNYTLEEIKLEKETQKILSKDIKVTATAVRVPVFIGHSESVNIEFNKPINIHNIIAILSFTKGIEIQEECTPLDCVGKENVLVGRIRRDHTIENGLNLWIVGDNLMKGAALNAVQIAEYIYNL